jgi:8-oxo-dGTP pyrophosphatase MutT (NUDIX family)
MDRPRVIPTAYLALITGDKILLSRRYNTGFYDGYYSFPAGHLKDDEETLSQTVIREAREEAGIEIDPADLELARNAQKTRGSDERKKD